jgi:hypothetical protein
MVTKAKLYDVTPREASGGTNFGKNVQLLLSVSFMKSSISCTTVTVTIHERKEKLQSKQNAALKSAATITYQHDFGFHHD